MVKKLLNESQAQQDRESELEAAFIQRMVRTWYRRCRPAAPTSTGHARF